MECLDPVPSNNCKNATVTFDVGGKLYKVSRSLLEQYPDTMLARLASETRSPGGKDTANNEDPKQNYKNKEQSDNGNDDDDSGGGEGLADANDNDDWLADDDGYWLGDHDDDWLADDDDGKNGVEDGTTTIGTDGDINDMALFIERDGERFRYCLDYMRDGKILGLPPTISKDAVLQDLAHYGFQGVDPACISVKRAVLLHEQSHKYIESLEKKLNDKLQKHKEGLAALRLAKYILREYKKRGSLCIRVDEESYAEFTRGVREGFVSYELIPHLKWMGFKLQAGCRGDGSLFELDYL